MTDLGTFRLEITMGNDAMDSPADVAAALRVIADQLDADPWKHPRTVRDLNGNTVGAWDVVPV